MEKAASNDDNRRVNVCKAIKILKFMIYTKNSSEVENVQAVFDLICLS